MKRILIFSLMYHPFIGGAEIAIKELTDRMPDLEFDMITLRVDKDLTPFEKIGNVNVHRVGFARKFGVDAGRGVTPTRFDKYLFPLTALLKALRLNRERKYDAIWAIMANYAGFAALFFKFLHSRIPYVLNLQEGDPIAYIKKRVGIFNPLFKKIFTKANHIHTISTHLKHYEIEMGYDGPIDVVPNGVDISRFAKEYPEYEIKALKRTLNKHPKLENVSEGSFEAIENTGDTFLITVSRLVEKNAVGDIISALQFLPPSVKLLILGTGPEMLALKELSDNLYSGTRVLFLGHISHEEIPKYLKVSNIFVRPSLSEGFGNAFVEAMAAGLPVIATPVGGITDFVFDPVRNPDKEPTGLYCNPHDPKSLAEKVELLLTDRALKKRIVGNARNMVNKKYDWHIIAKDMEEKVFKRVMA